MSISESDMSIRGDTENSVIRQKVAERIKAASRFTLPYAHFANKRRNPPVLDNIDN